MKQCVSSVANGGIFPDMNEALDYFESAFNHSLAKKEGNIIPNPGVDTEYDSATSELDELQSDLDNYLHRMKNKLNCRVCNTFAF